MSVDHLRHRLAQVIGLDIESRRGTKAFKKIAATLAPNPTTGSQEPISSQLPNPFNHLRFTARGVGFTTDEDGFLRSVTEHPIVTIVDPTGDEWAYQSRWGIVRKFPTDESPRPLTPQDADILRAAAIETFVLQHRRDQERSRIF